MAAKLREKGGFWWVVVHHRGRRKWKKVGTDKRVAQKVVDTVNAQIALGAFVMEPEKTVPTIEEALWRWHETYKPTFSDSFSELAESSIRRHLVPAFGKLRLNELEEHHLLRFIGDNREKLRASTLNNALARLRRVMALAVEKGIIDRNPCRNLGRHLAKMKRQQSSEVEHVNAWSREEVATLLDVAQREEASFYPLLAFLLHTGARKGEALGLRWEDVDLSDGRVLIRRALVRGRLGTPKSGKARSVALSPALAGILGELLRQRRRACVERGWSEVPDFVFCSTVGGPLEERNVTRSWYRVRRKAQAAGVRPLRLHDARHTYASLALAAGKSVRWVAAQLGHASPELTLRVYAHALREEEADLSFLDFGGTKRHPRGTEQRALIGVQTPIRATTREDSRNMVTRARLGRFPILIPWAA